MSILNRLKGCIIGGAIGDAWGSAFENIVTKNDDRTFYFGGKKEPGHIWNDDANLVELVLPELPDTKVRDQLIAMTNLKQDASIADAAALGTSGYAVHSIPFAVFSAMQAKKIGMEKMLEEIIKAGGDTDTNASISGRIDRSR